MTAKNSLLSINRCLTDDEIMGLHFEGCPHIDDPNERCGYKLLGEYTCIDFDKNCGKCWLIAIRGLE